MAMPVLGPVPFFLPIISFCPKLRQHNSTSTTRPVRDSQRSLPEQGFRVLPSALCLLQAASMGRSAPAPAASAGAAGERGPAPEDREHGLRGGQRVAGPARRRRGGRGRARAAAALPVHVQRVPHRRGAAGAPAQRRPRRGAAPSRRAASAGSSPAVARSRCARACRDLRAARAGPPWLCAPYNAPCPYRALPLASMPPAGDLAGALPRRGAHARGRPGIPRGAPGAQGRATCARRRSRGAGRGGAGGGVCAAAGAPHVGLVAAGQHGAARAQRGYALGGEAGAAPPPPWSARSLGGPSSLLPCKHTSRHFADSSPLSQPQARRCKEAVSGCLSSPSWLRQAST